MNVLLQAPFPFITATEITDIKTFNAKSIERWTTAVLNNVILVL